MSKEVNKNVEENKKVVSQDEHPICGIIMPISSLDGCSMEHWAQVKSILSEAINASGYKPSLVSDADDSGIIQKRIVQNIYDNEIVVCDVSGKNPNVMFELGMRLAFDKPTIIVIDDKTSYSFDTAPIEHLQYPRDLSYYSIIDFQNKLKDKITATIKASKDDSNYTTFLKHFGEFEVAHVEKKQGTLNDVILSRIDDLTQAVTNLERRALPKCDVKEIVKKGRISHQAFRVIINDEIKAFCKRKGIGLSNAFLELSPKDIQLIARELEEKYMGAIADLYDTRTALEDTIKEEIYLL